MGYTDTLTVISRSEHEIVFCMPHTYTHAQIREYADSKYAVKDRYWALQLGCTSDCTVMPGHTHVMLTSLLHSGEVESAQVSDETMSKQEISLLRRVSFGDAKLKALVAVNNLFVGCKSKRDQLVLGKAFKAIRDIKP